MKKSPMKAKAKGKPMMPDKMGKAMPMPTPKGGKASPAMKTWGLRVATSSGFTSSKRSVRRCPIS